MRWWWCIYAYCVCCLDAKPGECGVDNENECDVNDDHDVVYDAVYECEII